VNDVAIGVTTSFWVLDRDTAEHEPAIRCEMGY
jgi:hypothetical protein